MKKKLQKYLSGSNEGFSLVELIIVIAIMAILIGVVALAVIPYLEKSRESKDLQALSTLSNALSSAVADTKVAKKGSFTIEDGKAIAADTIGDEVEVNAGDAKKVAKSMGDSLGGAAVDVSSKGADGCKITCYFDPATNSVAVYIKTGQSNQGAQPDEGKGKHTMNGEEVQCCNYNDNAPLMVANGSQNGAAAEEKTE